MLELIFTYEPKDFSNYYKDTLGIKRIVKYTQKLKIVPLMFSSLVLAFCFSLMLFGGIYLWYWIYDVVLLGTFVLLYILFYYIDIAVQSIFGGKMIQMQQKGNSNDVKLTFNDDVILFTNGSNMQSTYPWSSIKDIYNTKYNLLIFTADISAIIIPKRIFKSNEEIENCWKYLQDCYNNAQNKN